ncbi:MAG: CbiX/SirB N-terminal domain-containing protein [Proteobacteria bacterium]|nr:CbiX/SirB N-terminal domain-containing protein [Pseudomonadota bacterium]MBS0493345.1 CbiX/SirB N-terminal domain-containing protein [Pseudomonadota bacterium]
MLAHGSRDPLWRRPIEAVRTYIQQDRPDMPVRCAYLELCAPSLAAALQELAALDMRSVTIVPLFVGAGRHVREDLPRMVQELGQAYPHVQLRLQAPIGEDARMTALMAAIASEAISP